MTKVIECNSFRRCNVPNGFLKGETGEAAIEGDEQEHR